MNKLSWRKATRDEARGWGSYIGGWWQDEVYVLAGIDKLKGIRCANDLKSSDLPKVPDGFPRPFMANCKWWTHLPNKGLKESHPEWYAERLAYYSRPPFDE
jgi:hypothetical protein